MKNRLKPGSPNEEESTVAFDIGQSNEWNLNFTDHSGFTDLYLFTEQSEGIR
jgi:hypothetical protein